MDTNFKGFIGGFGQLLSKYAGVERCVNFFPEVVETPDEPKSKLVLFPTPCTGIYSARAAQYGPCRGLLELNGILIGVNGATVYQFTPPSPALPMGQFVPYGIIDNDGLPISMIANGVTNSNQQVFIVTQSGHAYILDADGSNPPPLTDLGTVPGFAAGTGAAFLDDYFISIIPRTNGFQISSINDGLTWDQADEAFTQGQSDTLVNLIADREYLWLFGNRRSEIWYNQGGQFFPFAIQPGAFLEIGLQAFGSLIQADNSIFWIGQDKRGGLSAWRSNGLTPIRVSNHAVETAWSKYPTASITAATSYSFLWRGHTFVRTIFPPNPATGFKGAGWTYDCAASRQLGYATWHENSFTDGNGQQWAPLERAHAYFQGTHVVGSGGQDGFPGALYQFTDSTELPPNPQLLIRQSTDGGNTFGAERQVPAGASGQYEIRWISNLWRAARDCVFWVRCIDYGEAGGMFPITRDRICPHLYDGNQRMYYRRLEIEGNKAIGSQGGTTTGFWGLVNAYLTTEEGQN